MNSTAPKPERPDRQTPQQTGLEEEARAAQLRAANINPRTGLATDYLNHFNEAIMLLEMIPDMPECAEEFLEWQPRSYREHFAASNFRARELAIEAYDSANPQIRTEFDNITGAMISILAAVSQAMREASQDRPAPRWPNRPPAGSNRWRCWPAASSMVAAPRPTSTTS
jgi:hypothetical protein